jgi:hypothetical protein
MSGLARVLAEGAGVRPLFPGELQEFQFFLESIPYRKLKFSIFVWLVNICWLRQQILLFHLLCEQQI